MSIVLILGFVAVVAFVIGFSLVIKGYSGVPAADQIVPIEQMNQVQQALAASKDQEGKLKQQLDTLAVELQGAKSSIKMAKQMEADLRGEQEIEKNKVLVLDRDLKFLQQKTDGLAHEAIEVLQSMDTENAALRGEVESAKARPSPEDLQRVNGEKQALEQELQKIRDESQKQLDDAQEKITRLNADKRSLEMGLEEITAKIQAVETEVAKAEEGGVAQRQEAEELRKQLAAREEAVQKLREDLSRRQEDLDKARRTIEDLERHPVSVPPPPSVPAAGPSMMPPPSYYPPPPMYAYPPPYMMTPPQPAPASDTSGLADSLKVLKEQNELLIKKERMLQSELTKSRTQALGLEKICADYKAQMERDQER